MHKIGVYIRGKWLIKKGKPAVQIPNKGTLKESSGKSPTFWLDSTYFRTRKVMNRIINQPHKKGYFKN